MVSFAGSRNSWAVAAQPRKHSAPAITAPSRLWRSSAPAYDAVPASPTTPATSRQAVTVTMMAITVARGIGDQRSRRHQLLSERNHQRGRRQRGRPSGKQQPSIPGCAGAAPCGEGQHDGPEDGAHRAEDGGQFDALRMEDISVILISLAV